MKRYFDDCRICGETHKSHPPGPSDSLYRGNRPEHEADHDCQCDKCYDGDLEGECVDATPIDINEDLR
jgi:hypothetical protein